MSTSVSHLEEQLARAGARPRFLAGSGTTDVDDGRLAANFATINAEIDAPRPSRLARALARLGVDELTIPLITATPGLRRSWIISVVVALFFALSAASNNMSEGVDKIVVFLTIAPLVPLLGVALAFGRGVDPTHEIVLAAPMDSFRVFLARAITVLTTSTILLLVASALVPSGGAARVGWLLPAVAVTATTMALSTRLEPRLSAGIVAGVWVLLVVTVSQAADVGTMFGPVTQTLSFLVAIAGAGLFVARRRQLDLLDGGRSR